MPSTLKEQDKIAWSWAEFTDPKLITNDNIFSAYRIKENFCKNKSCRRNCRGNPFCLSGLGEAHLLDNVNNPLDDTIATLQKRAGDTFVGLKNLGATCYVNSLLQLWFHNKAFRDAIFSWDPLEDPIEQQNGSLFSDGPFTPKTVVGHLQQLFAMMYCSKSRYIDPSSLVESLRLNTSTQQDAQEFSKLFISLLENSLVNQSLHHVKNLINDNFRGEYMYVTRCCNCLTESVSPSTFYELELNVKGHNTLTECLTEFLQEEILEGADCYSCAVCQTKQEAHRFIKLCSLPPVLNLQLLRFVYDREKGQRKKLKTVVQFPELLDMKEFVQMDTTESLVYNLSAVLIHKGARASSGHFIAYIKDGVTGTWNTFNDERVEKLEGKKLKLDEEDPESVSAAKPKVPRLPKGFQSSTDAYMLVYTSEKHKPSPNEVIFSTRLQEYVDSQHKIFDEFCDEIALSKKQGLERQEQLLKMYTCLSTNDTDDLKDIDVLSSDWLVSWLKTETEESLEIDNTKLVCPHGRLDPHAVTCAKYVSGAMADTLYQMYGGGPRMRMSDFLCRPCVTNHCIVYRTRTKTLDESKEVANLLKKRMGVDEPGYYVHKYSLKTWRTQALNLVEGKYSSSDKTAKEISSLVKEESSEQLTEQSTPATQTTSSSDNPEKPLHENETSKPTPQTSPTTNGLMNLTPEKKVECRKRRTTPNKKYSRALLKRKHKTSVSVPLSEIRDCFVMCKRLQVNLNNPDGSSLLDQCNKLKVKLKKLSHSPKTIKTLNNLRRKSGEKSENILVKKDINNLIRNSAENNKEKEIFNGSCHKSQESKLDFENNSDNFQSCENSENCLASKDVEINKSDQMIHSNMAFNEAIMCPHGNLCIDEAERKLVPVRVWEILKQYFPAAPSFPHDIPPCHLCENLASKDEVVKQEYYESALTQKKTLSDLFYLRNRPIPGKTEDTIYILPKQNFHLPWSAFIRSATRRDNQVEPPISLKVETLLCAHELLHFSPDYEEDQHRVVLVTEQEWATLISMYTTDTVVTMAPDRTTSPELCQTCFLERLKHEQKEKLNYDRARLNIRQVPFAAALEDNSDESSDSRWAKKRRMDEGTTSPVPPELKNVMKSAPAAGDVRRSGRARKVPGQKNVHFMVSSSLTLRELKQMITSELAVAPFDQHLSTVDGKELHGDYDTLSSLGILPNSTLLLQVDEPKESFDDMLEGCSTPTEPEAGFKGTGLLA